MPGHEDAEGILGSAVASAEELFEQFLVRKCAQVRFVKPEGTCLMRPRLVHSSYRSPNPWRSAEGLISGIKSKLWRWIRPNRRAS